VLTGFAMTVLDLLRYLASDFIELVSALAENDILEFDVNFVMT